MRKLTIAISTGFLSLAGLLQLTGCGPAVVAEPTPVSTPTTAPTTNPTTGPTSQPADPYARVEKSLDEWKAQLSPEAFYILFKAGTERPFTHPYNKEKRKGVFVSIATGAPLFSSDDKYDSGTGWPSFTKPIDDRAVIVRQDPDGSGRLEVLCASSGGHLGHVFDDGPAPTGLRYCMNGAALRFIPASE